MFYQTGIMTHKILKTGNPLYLGNKMISDFPYRTRLATTGAIRYGEEFGSRRALNHSSFRFRATVEYNRLPGSIREANSVHTFKTKLRLWTQQNISVT